MSPPGENRENPNERRGPAGQAASEQLRRLEARIRDFHTRLAELDDAEGQVNALGPARSAGSGERPGPPLQLAEDIRRQAQLEAEDIRDRAERDAANIRRQADTDASLAAELAHNAQLEAEKQMQQLWRSLDLEVRAIQDEVSERVERLTAKMEAVGEEAERIRSQAVTDAGRVRGDAQAMAARIVATAEQESDRLISAARSAAETVRARAVDEAEHDAQAARDGLIEQLREAAAVAIKRIGRTEAQVPDPLDAALPSDGADSIQEVLNGLSAAVAMIEHCLEGLVDLAGEGPVPDEPSGFIPDDPGGSGLPQI